MTVEQFEMKAPMESDKEEILFNLISVDSII